MANDWQYVVLVGLHAVQAVLGLHRERLSVWLHTRAHMEEAWVILRVSFGFYHWLRRLI